MNAYMRGFVILFVLLVLLSYLPPGKQYRKYIRFYAQLLMVLAALRPLFVLFSGKDTFYEKMAYAQCMEKLSEFSRDTQKIAYLNQDRYRTEYENVIAENIREKVDDMLQEYGLGAESVTVELGEDHTMQEICIYITDENADEISVRRISVSDAAESGEGQEVCGKVKEELAAYYGMEDSGIRVSYVGGTSMPEKLKRILQNKNWRSWKKSDWLLLALVGILLLVIALPVESGDGTAEKAYNTAQGEKEVSGGSGRTASGDSGGTASGSQTSEEGEQEYVQYLEKKLENILMQMDGVGRVDVMITVSDGGEQIVEKDKKTTSSSTGERDSGGGERSVTEQAGEDSTVYVETADEKYPYVQKETLPTVAGVVVVAEGGGNPAAVSEISESVQALLKVEPHRIRVVKMCSREESE